MLFPLSAVRSLSPVVEPDCAGVLKFNLNVFPDENFTSSADLSAVFGVEVPNISHNSASFSCCVLASTV